MGGTMSLKQRYLGERTETRMANWTVDGKTFEAPASSHTYSVNENDCKHCGKAYEIKGIFGQLREMRFEDTCPNCEHLEPDPNISEAQTNVS